MRNVGFSSVIEFKVNLREFVEHLYIHIAFRILKSKDLPKAAL